MVKVRKIYIKSKIVMKLIDKYKPSDYYDCEEKNIKRKEPLCTNYIFDQMFCHYPKPVAILMKIRNAMVKPLGLKGGNSFRELISESNAEEIVAYKNDRHLCFWVSVYCSLPIENQQNISITTVVKFNNLLGKLYFACIWVFHKILEKKLFREAIKEN